MSELADSEPEEAYEDCWSTEPSTDKIPLCSGTAFYVSSEVLQDLQKRFGPAAETNGSAYASCSRYGFQLIAALLGPQRLRLSKKHSVGAIKPLKDMLWNVDIFFIVLQHARHVWGLPAVTAESVETDRRKFRSCCNTMLRDRLSSSGRPSKNKTVYSKEHQKPSRERGKSTKRTADIGLQMFSDEPSTSSLLSYSEPSPSEVAVELSILGVKDPIKRFMDQVVRNHTSVCEDSLRNMMQDKRMQVEVQEVMRIQQQLLNKKQNHKKFFKAAADFVTIKEPGREICIPVEQLHAFYAEGWSVKKGVPDWNCRHCNWACLEEESMQYHVTKQHFFRSVSSHALAATHKTDSHVRIPPVPTRGNQHDSTRGSVEEQGTPSFSVQGVESTTGSCGGATVVEDNTRNVKLSIS